jgi:hypothetical protein
MKGQREFGGSYYFFNMPREKKKSGPPCRGEGGWGRAGGWSRDSQSLPQSNLTVRR